MAEDPGPRKAQPTWSDGMRYMNEMSAKMSDAARVVAVAGARFTPPELSAQLAGYTQRVLAVHTVIVEPLRRMLDEQQQLTDRLAGWADQHQHISDQIAALANQQRHLTEQMNRWMSPLFDQVDTLEQLNAAWTTSTDDEV